MNGLMARWPRISPLTLELSCRFMSRYEHVWDCHDAFHYLDNIPKVWLGSTVVAIEDTQAVFARIKELIEEEAEKGQFPVNLALHARFVKASDAHLAMTRDRDSCCIEVATLADTVGIEPFIAKLHQVMAEEFNARPHWGKGFYDLKSIPALYGEPFVDFAKIRGALDPEERFMNPLFKELFAAVPSQTKHKHALHMSDSGFYAGVSSDEVTSVDVESSV